MLLKCKMCGGDLQPAEGMTTVECEFCGTMQTIATADSEKKTNLFNRANRLRMASEFDKAAAVYENIVAEFPEEAEAYWGLCLCAYGIEYVDDPASGRKIPTCHRTLPESIMDSSNFEMACDYADSVAKKLYRSEAKEIDRLQKEILAIVANEAPYDVFICYKETDESGNRTEDSVLGQDIYDALTAKGMKVFFARITLEDKLGQQYEPYIYAALHSAKVMLAIGTSFEHYDAVWVKNEWSRYLDMASKDKSKNLIPCYKNIDAYDIPKEFRNLQAQDMNKLGWLQDLVRGVIKLIGGNEVAQNRKIEEEHRNDNRLRNYLQIAENALNAGNNVEAENYCNKILEEDFNYAEAWRIKGLALMNTTNRIVESENCLQRYYSVAKGDKADLAKIIVSSYDNYFKTTWPKVLGNLSVNDISKSDACISILSNAKTVYQKIYSYTGRRSEILYWMTQQMEKQIIEIWETQVRPYMQRNQGYPSNQDFNSFLKTYEKPLSLMEQLVETIPDDSDGNVRRLQTLQSWANYAKNGKSWHFETEDEMFDRVGVIGAGRQGLNRTINLAIHTQQWVADHEMSTERRAFWQRKIDSWNVMIARFEAEKREEAKRIQEEQHTRIEQYWQRNPEEKKQLELKIQELKEQFEAAQKQIEIKLQEIESARNVAKDVRVPAEEKKEYISEEIKKLREERASLGLFSGGKKKSIDARIQTLYNELPNADAINEQRNAMTNQMIQPLKEDMANCKERIREISNQIAAIQEELTRPR